MPDGRVAVYGFSSEGYAIASTLAAKGTPTVIIDENLHMAMELKPDVAASYKSVRALIDAETLLALKSVDASVSESEFIFFAPKIRRSPSEVEGEISGRLSDVAKYISKGSTLVYGLPSGLDGNFQTLSIIERVSGLKSGEDFDYFYAPLSPTEKSPRVIGATKPKPEKKTVEFLKSVAIKVQDATSVATSEAQYCREITSKYATMTSHFEFQRRIVDRAERERVKKSADYKEFYIEDLCENLLDLRLLVASVETGEPLLYLASGSLKSVEAYNRYLVEQLRGILREMELKASKTRIILAWSRDDFEVRGDKKFMIEALVERLHDYIGDVESVNLAELMESRESVPLSSDRTNLVVACSKNDYSFLTSGPLKLRGSSNGTFLIKANLLVERL